MSDLLAFLIRVGQRGFWGALLLILLASAWSSFWPLLVLILVVGVYRSLDAYANRVEEARAKRQVP